MDGLRSTFFASSERDLGLILFLAAGLSTAQMVAYHTGFSAGIGLSLTIAACFVSPVAIAAVLPGRSQLSRRRRILFILGVLYLAVSWLFPASRTGPPSPSIRPGVFCRNSGQRPTVAEFNLPSLVSEKRSPQHPRSYGRRGVRENRS
jgi:hypothetical protein